MAHELLVNDLLISDNADDVILPQEQIAGLEIDMFEMFAMLIIFTRSDLSKRLQLIFELFCYNEEEYMQKGEFKFMLNKLCNAIGSTI